MSHRHRHPRSPSPRFVARFLLAVALLSAHLPATVALPSSSVISFPSLSHLSHTLLSRLSSAFSRNSISSTTTTTTSIPSLSLLSRDVTTTTTTSTSKSNSASSSYDDINAPSAAASVIGHGFTEYDGTYDSSRVRRPILLTSSSASSTSYLQPSSSSSSSSSLSATRTTHSALGFADFALTLKRHIAQPGGVHAFLNNVRLHFSATTSSGSQTVYGRAAVTVAHSTVTLVPASEKEEEEEEEGGNNKNEMFEFVPEALNDILSLPPKRVFTLYGTHVVTGLIYGGELSLWGSVSTDDTSCYNRCVGSTSTSSSSDSEEVINQHHKCFDAAFDAYVQGFDFINPFRRSNADCVDTAGLTTIGGHRLNSSFSAWVSSVPRVPRAIALSGAAPLWDLLRAHGYGEKAWLLETYYYRHIMPRHAYIVKQFTGAWAEESAKPTATVSVPRGWKIVSGGVEMSERKGYGQLVTRSYPVTRNDMTARTVAAQRSSGGVGNGGGSGGDHVDDEQTELPSVHDFESTIRTVTNNKTTDQQDTSGIVTWEVQAKDHLHIASGSVRAIAIALWDPTDDYVVSVTRSTSSDAYRPQTTVSTAPSSKGYTVVGGGACVHWVQPGCLLTTSAPTTQGRKAAGWRAAASDHLVSSVGSITAFAVSLKRTDGDEVETISRSGLSDQGVDTYATLSANEEEDSNDDAWWRFVSAGVDVVTAIQGGGGAGGAGAAAAREKAFVIGVGVDENGESVIGQASSYVKEIRHRLRVSGVMLQGAVFVSRAGTAGHIGDDVGAL